MSGHLYFHAPCFDGIVSAVLTWDYLESKQGWQEITFHPVNYHLRDNWLSSQLEKPAAVVDFLYHPDAAFWADHHSTTFLNKTAKSDFERNPSATHVYQQSAKSCAGLLWVHLYQAFGHRNPHYKELVHWADKTDSADYESVSEAITGQAPALRISMGLALGDNGGYCESLMRTLRDRTLEEVADLPRVRERFERTQEMIKAGLDRFLNSIKMDRDGFVVFDVDSKGVIINRYAPFYFYPKARYSAGIVRWKEGAKITAMRNPWLKFPSVFLDRIFEKFGGGGHQRVGSVVLRGERVSEATAVLEQLLSVIRREDKASGGGKVL